MIPVDPRGLLKQLIALPSVNPMGRDLSGPEYLEGRVTDFLETFFRQIGANYRRWDVSEGRSNIVALHAPRNARRTILLDAHQDTVPVDGMTIAPFDPMERDGRILGRGACDVKGGMAAMLAAFARLIGEDPDGTNAVALSCTCDEESTSTGIENLVRRWTDPGGTFDLVPQRPDIAIVAEPTDLDIVVAHRGAARWKAETTGRACHSSEPRNGINAIYRMAPLLAALETYAAQLPASVPAHPLCGPATLSVGRIEGGLSVNTVPDRCTIEIDRRIIPGEDGWQAIEDARDFLQSRGGVEFRFQEPWLVSPPLSDENNRDVAEQLMHTVSRIAGAHVFRGVAYGTHASRTAVAGIPSVVFGPGSIEQAHTDDEWIDVKQLELAAEIYFAFCRDS